MLTSKSSETAVCHCRTRWIHSKGGLVFAMTSEHLDSLVLFCRSMSAFRKLLSSLIRQQELFLFRKVGVGDVEPGAHFYFCRRYHLFFFLQFFNHFPNHSIPITAGSVQDYSKYSRLVPSGMTRKSQQANHTSA